MRFPLTGPVFVLVLLTGGAASADYAVTDIVDAARRGDGHAVHKLLELGPEAAAGTDEEGSTALHWAAIRGHWRIVAELVAAGAPVNAVNADGGTPLHWACHHDRADMVTILLDAGAEAGVEDREGWTPLHVAARRGCAGVSALLLDHGAEVDATTREGWTPLHVAYRSGHPEMVELLLARGADPERRDRAGERPDDRERPRPAAVVVAPESLAEYAGLYLLGSDVEVKVWREGGGLRIRELAPDDLVPVGPDRFWCRQEPWEVGFVRDRSGAVVSVEIDTLRRTVSGDRVPAPRYVGSQACMPCHHGVEAGHQYVRWLQSRHAHAYWRLGADWALFLGRLRPQYQDLDAPMSDQRCLLCHVTGAQDENALFAVSYRVEEGVGCEACHGPGSDYMDPEVMADRERFLAHGGVVPDADTCRGCHRNSERFDFAEWWPKIAHPRPEAGAAGTH